MNQLTWKVTNLERNQTLETKTGNRWEIGTDTNPSIPRVQERVAQADEMSDWMACFQKESSKHAEMVGKVNNSSE